MKIRKLYIAIGVIVLAVAGGAGHFWYSSRTTHAFKKTVEDIQKGLPVGSSLTYSGLGMNAYRSNGGLRNVFYDSAKVSITVSTIRLRDFERDGEDIKVAVINFDDITITLKDKGIKYHVKQGQVHNGNLGKVVRALRRSSPAELGRMLEASEIVVTDITSGGKALRLAVDELRAGDISKGTAGSFNLKGVALAEGGPTRSIGACAGNAIQVESVGDWAAATVNPEQEATLLSDITAVCK